MKTKLIFLLLIGLSVSTFAQHDFSIKPLPKIDFNSGIQKQDSSYMKFDNIQKSPDYLMLLSPKSSDRKPVSILRYKSKMPIAKPYGNYWDMPVAIPDSTVNYAIREKRIEYLNPGEKK